MDSRTEEQLKHAINEYENMRDKTERTYYQNCLVAMGDEVQRLRAKLTTIAFPRRGSPEAGWGVEEIGRFAAEGQGGAEEVDTDLFVEDALRDLVPADFHPDKRLLTRMKLLVEAWRRDKESLSAFQTLYLKAREAIPPRFKGNSLEERVAAMARELEQDSPVPQMDAQGRVLVAPAAQQDAYHTGVADFALRTGSWISDKDGKWFEEQAAKRYPDAAGEESRPNPGLFDSFLESTRNLADTQPVTVSAEHWRDHKLETTLGALRQFVSKKGGAK